MKEKNILASLALFGKLYDEKKDVYNLVADFVKGTIVTHKKMHFSTPELVQDINSTFEFNLPEAVIKTALRKICQNYNLQYDKKTMIYTCDLELFKDAQEIQTRHDKHKEEYTLIISDLLNYAEKAYKDNLLKEQREGIIDCFYDALLGRNPNNDYSQIVNAYIIELEKDKLTQLNSIREGLIIYEGIVYTPDLSVIGKWNSKLTIFLSTEHLFHCFGLNGDTYKNVFNDFLMLVKEINKNEDLINLKYFSETREEIEKFFKKAEYLIENKKGMVSLRAMESILDDCNSVSDIVTKKSSFFHFLDKNKIKEDKNYNYLIEENQQYNLNGLDIIQKLKEDGIVEEDNDISQILNQFTKINVLRKGCNNTNFEKCQYILLSDKAVSHAIVQKGYIKENIKSIPFVINLELITNKLWFYLNKGFSDKSRLPSSFDVAIRAKMAFSGQLSQNIREKYHELRQKEQENITDKEELTRCLLEMRRFNLAPEDVSKKIICETLDFMSVSAIEWEQRENAKLAKQVKIGKEALLELKNIQSNSLIKSRKINKMKYSIYYRFVWAVTYLVGFLFIGLCIASIGYGINIYRTENDTILAIVFGLLGLIAPYKFHKKILIYINNNLQRQKKKIIQEYSEKIKVLVKKFQKTSKELESV